MKRWWPALAALATQQAMLLGAFAFWSAWSSDCPWDKSDCLSDGQYYAFPLWLALAGALVLGVSAAWMILETCWVDVPGWPLAGVTSTAVVGYLVTSAICFRSLADHGERLSTNAQQALVLAMVWSVPPLCIAARRTGDR